MQQRSEKASRRRRLIGKAPLRKRISPKRACENAHQFPMGKVKGGAQKTSLCYGYVSIPYGKGKVTNTLEVFRQCMYQFPMGKVKSRGMDVVILDHQYQFPMGKVKRKTIKMW